MDLTEKAERIPTLLLDFPAERMNQKATKMLAESIRSLGLLHEPLVQKNGERYLVVAGRTRCAACRILGWESVPCKVLSCDADVAAYIERAENAYRRHDKREQMRDLREIFRLKRREYALKFPEGKVSRKLMIKEVAQELGLSESYLAAHAFKTRTPTMRSTITCHGIEHLLDETWIAEIESWKKYIEGLSSYVTSYTGRLAGRDDELLDLLMQLGTRCKQVCPAHLCPWCKGISGLVESCAPCRSRGWLAKAESYDIPAELWDSEEPKVIVDGELRRVADVVEMPQTDWGEF